MINLLRFIYLLDITYVPEHRARDWGIAGMEDMAPNSSGTEEGSEGDLASGLNVDIIRRIGARGYCLPKSFPLSATPPGFSPD